MTFSWLFHTISLFVASIELSRHCQHGLDDSCREWIETWALVSAINAAGCILWQPIGRLGVFVFYALLITPAAAFHRRHIVQWFRNVVTHTDNRLRGCILSLHVSLMPLRVRYIRTICQNIAMFGITLSNNEEGVY